MTILAAGASASITLQVGSALNISGTGLAVVNNNIKGIDNRGVVGPFPGPVTVYLTATTAMDYASFTPNTRTASAQYGGPRSQAQIDAMNTAYAAGKIDIPTSYSVFNTDTNSTWRFNGTALMEGAGNSTVTPGTTATTSGTLPATALGTTTPVNSASATVQTLPPASAAFAASPYGVNGLVVLYQMGLGVPAFAAGSGDTLRSTSGIPVSVQYGQIAAMPVSATEWALA